jgi:tripartite ATP-independent transporter DctP family solute receptor
MFAFLFVGCGAGNCWCCGAADSSAKNVTFKAASSVDPQHAYHLALVKFGQILSEKTNGRLKVDIYHSSQLGSDRELLEAEKMGTVDFAATASAPAISFIPEIGVLDLPYLFKDRVHAYAVLDSAIGGALLNKLESQNIKGLAFFENGWRCVTNSVYPIRKAEDMKGIKIRVMESPVYIDMFKAVGAIPTPMAWGEVFVALQQGTVDAQENPVNFINSQRLDDVQKYLSLTEHTYSAALFTMSKKTFNKLSVQDQEVILEAAKETKDYERQLSMEQSDKAIEEIRKRGKMQVIDDVLKDSFKERMQTIYSSYESKYGKELVDSIINYKM